MAWPRTALTDRLGIDYPIIAAPMAGVTTTALAAAASNGGGLGSLATARGSVADVERAVAELRALTNKPFNLNFFAHKPPARSATRERRLRELVDLYYDELGLAVPAESKVPPPFEATMAEAVASLSPAVVSFHFGLPAPALLALVKKSGAMILCTATTVAEARALEAAGADAIIAQGAEAGGHRGTFLAGPQTGRIGTMALVPQVVDAVSVPVVAAGGIADGRGIAAALALGASGVQIGTAFIPTPESGAAKIYKAMVMAARDDQTTITSVFTGRPARVIANRYVAELAPLEAGFPDYPLPLALSQPLGAAAIQRGSSDFTAMHAGQAAALARGLPAAMLFARLVEETEAALARLAPPAARPTPRRKRQPRRR